MPYHRFQSRPQKAVLHFRSLPTLAEETGSSLYGVAGQPPSVENEEGMGALATRAFRGSSDVCRSEGSFITLRPSIFPKMLLACELVAKIGSQIT